jgi:hypothetical protein
MENSILKIFGSVDVEINPEFVLKNLKIRGCQR